MVNIDFFCNLSEAYFDLKSYAHLEENMTKSKDMDVQHTCSII